MQLARAKKKIQKNNLKEWNKPFLKKRKEDKFIKKFNEYYGHAFEYISGYESNNTKSFIVIRCKECGHIRKRNRTEIFQGDNIVCPVCNNNKKIVKDICDNCGVEFTKYCPQQILCNSCHDEREKEKQRIHKRLREAKATKNGKVDYSITLSKLIERDNHICQLCGRMVDETD